MMATIIRYPRKLRVLQPTINPIPRTCRRISWRVRTPSALQRRRSTLPLIRLWTRHLTWPHPLTDASRECQASAVTNRHVTLYTPTPTMLIFPQMRMGLLKYPHNIPRRDRLLRACCSRTHIIRRLHDCGTTILYYHCCLYRDRRVY